MAVFLMVFALFAFGMGYKVADTVAQKPADKPAITQTVNQEQPKEVDIKVTVEQK
jgi:hypothetical protein